MIENRSLPSDMDFDWESERTSPASHIITATSLSTYSTTFF